jgi:hypothetical protein
MTRDGGSALGRGRAGQLAGELRSRCVVGHCPFEEEAVLELPLVVQRRQFDFVQDWCAQASGRRRQSLRGGGKT